MRSGAGVFTVGSSFDQAATGEPEKDVLERTAANERALGFDVASLQGGECRFTVGGVDEQAIGQFLDPLGHRFGVRDVCRIPSATESEFENLSRGVGRDQFGRRTFGDDPTAVHDDEAVAELLGLVHVVGGEDQVRPCP